MPRCKFLSSSHSCPYLTPTHSYNDDFLATFTEDPAFFGDKSIVVHLSNKTRIACANFKELSPGDTSTTASAATSYGTSYPTSYGTSVGTSYGTALPSSSAGGHNSSTSASPTKGESTGAPIQPTASPTASPSSPVAGAGAGKVVASGAALFGFVAVLML